MKTFYVYEHLRCDTGAIFYVGKGSGWRAGASQGRNDYWANIVAKSGGFIARKIAFCSDEELVFLAEQERIDQLKKLGCKLANLTSGGDGASNISEETRKKKSQRMSGANNPRFSENSRRQRLARKEFVPKEIMSENMKKNHWSKTGKYKPEKGRKISEETREKLKEAIKRTPLKTCPHCGCECKPVTLARWHGNNCKLKGNTMAKNERNHLNIDGVEYTFEDMTEQQQALVNHCLDLDRKIANAQFQLDQLRVGKDAFFAMLKQSLAEQPEHAEEVESAGLTE